MDVLSLSAQLERSDRDADAILTRTLRRRGLPLQHATGWGCDPSGLRGIEEGSDAL